MPRVLCLKCKAVIESRHLHDFVTCTCGATSVDGGPKEPRFIGNLGGHVVLASSVHNGRLTKLEMKYNSNGQLHNCGSAPAVCETDVLTGYVIMEQYYVDGVLARGGCGCDVKPGKTCESHAWCHCRARVCGEHMPTTISWEGEPTWQEMYRSDAIRPATLARWPRKAETWANGRRRVTDVATGKVIEDSGQEDMMFWG